MVGKVCTVCRNGSYLNKKLSFFTYPADPERRYHWLNAVHRLDLYEKLTNDKTRANHRICEVHFEKKFVKQNIKLPNARKYLAKDAVPTLHLDNPGGLIIHTSQPGEYVQSGYRKKDCRVIIEPTSSDLDVSDTEPCTDVSGLCESVMTVSNDTLTFQQAQGNQQVGVSQGASMKKLHGIKVERMRMSNHQNIFKASKSSHRPNIFQPEKGKRNYTDRSCCDDLSSGYSQQLKWAQESTSKSDNFNLLALNLYYSGNAYELLKNILNLPTLDTIKQHVTPKTTNLNANINAFKAKVKNMAAKERICSVAIGKVDLKTNLYYDITCDRIMGFQDVDGKQETKPADFAIVAAAQGIVENWVQPVACALFSNQIDCGEVSMWIDTVISKLIDTGLDVRAYVSDLRCDHRLDSGVTLEQPYFLVNGKDIFYVYDTSQLMEVVNWILKSCNIYYNGNILDTNDFLNKLNDLCDILNAKSLGSTSGYQRSFSNEKLQTDFLIDMISLLQNLKIVRRFDGKDITRDVEFVNNFVLTIKSIMHLFEDLNSVGVKFLLGLTHDYYLNKFFDKIKKTTDDKSGKCTGRDFNRCFVKCFLLNLLKKPLGTSKQSLANSLEIEIYSQELMNECQSEGTSKNFNTPLRISTTDYRHGLPEQNAFEYLCGYLYFKCLQRHCCETFNTYTRTWQTQNEIDNNRKYVLPELFTNFTAVLEAKFRTFLESKVEIVSIGHQLLQEMDNCVFDMPCPCFPIDYLKTVFIRAKIFYTLVYNKRLRKQTGDKLFRIFRL